MPRGGGGGAQLSLGYPLSYSNSPPINPDFRRDILNWDRDSVQAIKKSLLAKAQQIELVLSILRFYSTSALRRLKLPPARRNLLTEEKKVLITWRTKTDSFLAYNLNCLPLRYECDVGD